LRIVGVCPNEDVEAFRRAGVAMKRDRVSAQDHELGARVVQLDEKITKVFGQLDHVSRPGTKRHTICERV
jgi:hypothetical protein